ncbi:MAG TPA: IS110 family transposase, partial [Candidatus Babeliales bacterium]|nr:IS110 family transposase [Candidatus Babeliales bacterium]
SVYVGVDIAKAKLDTHIHPTGEHFTVENSKAGIQGLLVRLAKYQVQQVVFEASGGYELLLQAQLTKAQLPGWRVNPARVSSFRAAEGMHAKSDSFDAKALALFAAKNSPNYAPHQASATEAQLKLLIERRADLIKMLIAEKARLKAPECAAIRKSIARIIKVLEAEIKNLDQEINALAKASEPLSNKLTVLTSIPGIAQKTAVALLATMPELATIDGKKACALIGVAPYTRQSGMFKGKEFIRGGRFVPRKALYMAVLTGVRCNPVLKEFYQRLITKGKRPKVALIAAMRKLVVIITVMLRKNQTWQVAV